MRYGYFDDEKREYVITRPDTPAPWVNYLGSPEYGAIISNNAGGYSFEKSGANGRILRYVFNQFDEPGRYIYIRDNESKDYWSASWQPVGKDLEEYKSECHHGTAYTRMIAQYAGISSEVLYYVPLDKSYEIWDLKVTNNSDKNRKLNVTGYAEFTNNCNYEQDQVNLQYSQFITSTHFAGNRVMHHVHGNLDALKESEYIDNKNVLMRFLGMAVEKIRFMLSAQVDNGGGLPLVKFTHNPGHEDTPDDASYVQETGHPAYRADDALWLFPTVYKYISETGNMEFLDEVIPFANKDEATVYEHLQRAVKFSAEHLGKHGMPAGLYADWNDCLRLGKDGESSFVAMQYYYAMTILRKFAEYKNDDEYVKQLDKQQEKLGKLIQKICYDEDRFIRGFTEEGKVIGKRTDAEANMWLILAEALLKHGDRAFEYFMENSPAAQNDRAETRVLEPYCYGQFTEGKASPNFGRSHVHWLTGTASTVMVGCVEGDSWNVSGF